MSNRKSKVFAQNFIDQYLDGKQSEGGWPEECVHRAYVQYQEDPAKFHDWFDPEKVIAAAIRNAWGAKRPQPSSDQFNLFKINGIEIDGRLRYPHADTAGGYRTVINAWATVDQLRLNLTIKEEHIKAAQLRYDQTRSAYDMALARSGGDYHHLLRDLKDPDGNGQ